MKGFIIKIVSVLLPLIFSQISPSSANAKGAPSSACDNLIPQHGTAPQTSPSPYKVLLDQTTLQLKSPLTITLTSKNGREQFKGFLVQVRRVEAGPGRDKKPLIDGGTFEDNPQSTDAKMLACSGKPNVAMTHKGPEEKITVTVRWIPDTPGQYRVHSTFVKDGGTFWANQVDDQVIEVHPQQGEQGQSSSIYPGDIAVLCSTMKLNASLEAVAEEEAGNPYRVSVTPQKVYQKGKVWFNVSSEFGLPILKMFVQIRGERPSDNGGPSAVGTFVSVSTPSVEGQKGMDMNLVDCFGGKSNGILLMNRMHSRRHISDVSIQWEAPEDQAGDFKMVATAQSQDDVFWDRVGNDPEARKVKVVRGASTWIQDEASVSSSSTTSSTNFFGLGITIRKSNGINGTTASKVTYFIFKLLFFFVVTMIGKLQ